MDVKQNSGVQSVLPQADVPLDRYRDMIQAADGLSLGQVCSIATLEPSTVQNWVKRGFVPHPIGKKYHERHLARILLIAALRDGMQIDQIGALLTFVNGDADDESDDIVSEEQLYGALCRIVRAARARIPDFSEIPALVRSVTQDYNGPSPAAALRLREALSVMACAAIAGMYKQEAERRFTALREKQED